MAFVYWIRAPHHTDVFTEGYVGFTSNTVEDRMATHQSDSIRTKCKNYPVYHAFRKYGEDIVAETLIEGSDEYCLDMEYKLRPTPKVGWNILCGGQKGSLGTKVSEETRKKLSEARQGENNTFHGKTHSDEQKAKWSVSRSEIGFPKSSLAKSLQTKSKFPWRVANARQDVWAKAHIIHEAIGLGFSGVLLAREVGFPKDSLKTIVKRILSGWSPLDDPLWLNFKQSYEESQYDKAK